MSQLSKCSKLHFNLKPSFFAIGQQFSWPAVGRILRKSKFNLKQKGKVGIFYICWFSTAEFPNTRWFEIYFQILKYENVSSLLGFQVTDSICHPLHWNSHFVTSMIWTHHHISGGCQVSHINLEDFKQIYISLRKTMRLAKFSFELIYYINNLSKILL